MQEDMALKLVTTSVTMPEEMFAIARTPAIKETPGCMNILHVIMLHCGNLINFKNILVINTNIIKILGMQISLTSYQTVTTQVMGCTFMK